MIYRDFGNNDIKVSALGYGAGVIGDSRLDNKTVDILLNSILDLGINLIDTARGYGLSEERIGKFISHRRKEFILSTKVGYDIPGTTDWTYDCVTKGIDAALAKLKTDYIDIVHLHSCPKSTLEKGEVIEALLNAVDTGKVRIAAYSGDSEGLVYAVNSNKFKSIMASISICDQQVMGGLLQDAKNKHMGVISKRPLANCVWKYKEPPNYDKASNEYWDRLNKMNFKFDMDWNELALRFSVFAPNVDSCVVASTNIEHITQNIAYIQKGKLPEDIFNTIRAKFVHLGTNWEGQI